MSDEDLSAASCAIVARQNAESLLRHARALHMAAQCLAEFRAGSSEAGISRMNVTAALSSTDAARQALQVALEHYDQAKAREAGQEPRNVPISYDELVAAGRAPR